MSAVVSSRPDIPDEATALAVEAVKSIIPNTGGILWYYEHEDGQGEPVTLDYAMRAALVAAYPALTRQAVEDDPTLILNSSWHYRAVDDAVAAERERIATAIETQEFQVDLNVIAVPDGIDPEFARSAAITYFHSIAMMVREQAAAIARTEPDPT